MFSFEITKFSSVKTFFNEFVLIKPIFVSYSGKIWTAQQRQCYDGFQTNLSKVI